MLGYYMENYFGLKCAQENQARKSAVNFKREKRVGGESMRLVPIKESKFIVEVGGRKAHSVQAPAKKEIFPFEAGKLLKTNEA